MTQRTTLQTLSGAQLSLSATLPATYDNAGYTALSWTQIGEIENFGNHGTTAGVQTFTPVGSAVMEKYKGSKNYGVMNLVVGYLPSDAGQALVETAVESTNRYSAKIVYPLGQGEATAETHFLEVLVTKREFQDGTVDSVRKSAIDLEVCKKPVITAAT
jgi:hypothetical protein